MRRYFSVMLFLLALSHSSFAPPVPTYTKSELLGYVQPAAHSNFKAIHSRYAARDGLYMRKAAYKAFRQMWRAAQKEGVALTIISAFRSNHYQKGIWNRKWQAQNSAPAVRVQNIMQYSSMPGISRHHWGTDIDINALNNSYFESARGRREYQWLQKHAVEYGFFQPYSAFNTYRDRGYHEEKWHWSYYPTSSVLQRAYALMVDYSDLEDFQGAHLADSLQVIEHFVQGIELPVHLLQSNFPR